MGLKKVVVFVEAKPGLEDVLLESIKLHNYWLFLCRAYGPYEGCAGIWTVPKGREENFVNYLNKLKETGVARSFELYWTTCHEGVNVQSRWFSVEENVWTFNWDEWMKEVETIEGELPWTLKEPDDWPIRVDREDLLIIKELEIDGRRTFTDISKRLEIPLETVKYHFREHISKRNLIEGYQVEIYRFPSLISEYLFFKFEFDTYEQLVKFALSLHDKPFPFHLGKVLGENTLTTHLYLPKWEFRKFVGSLSKLIKQGLLKSYRYFIQDMFQTWRETIPYQHFVEGKWNYDEALYMDKLQRVLDKWGLG